MLYLLIMVSKCMRRSGRSSDYCAPAFDLQSAADDVSRFANSGARVIRAEYEAAGAAKRDLTASMPIVAIRVRTALPGIECAARTRECVRLYGCE